MIGTTLRVGFDGTEIGRGLGGITKRLGGFGKEIGIGAAQRVGHQVTDLLGRLAMSLPNAINDTMEWSGTMNDMAIQTGMTVEQLILLEEKLRLSGAEAKDTSRMISTLNAKLYEAQTEGGAAREALNKLGYEGYHFMNKNPAEAFDMIGKRVAALPDDFKGLESVMAELFGTRMGYKLIRFYRTFDSSSAKATHNVGQFAKAMNHGLTERIDDFGDAMGRWETWKRSMTTTVLDYMFTDPRTEKMPDYLYDMFNPEKLRSFMGSFTNTMGRNTEALLQGDASFSDMFINFGEKLGEGFKKTAFPSVKDLLFGSNAGPTQGAGPDKLLAATERGNTILSDIRREGRVATWG